MQDGEKTKAQLIHELTFVRKRIVELDASASDRRRAEEKLRKSEAEYRNIFENAIEGIYRTSPEGRFLTANPTAARLLGYESPEELISSITDITTQIYANPGDRDEAVRLMREQGFIKNFEVQCRRKDGSIVWGSLSARIVRDENGQVLYQEGTSQDITERKRAEEALQHSQQMLQNVLDNFPGVVFWKDRNSVYQGCNKVIRQSGRAQYARPKSSARQTMICHGRNGKRMNSGTLTARS